MTYAAYVALRINDMRAWLGYALYYVRFRRRSQSVDATLYHNEENMMECGNDISNTYLL
jgi:hypothetical protein